MINKKAKRMKYLKLILRGFQVTISLDFDSSSPDTIIAKTKTEGKIHGELKKR
jgi:hypothetical protein